MSRKLSILLVTALLFSVLLAPAPAMAQPAAGPGIPIASVPLEFVRLAAQRLEDMRGSPMTPEWDNSADLLPMVMPLYRPDVKGIAYYEFIVKLGGSKDAGFIVVSTSGHDFPIPHWSSSGKSPTEELDALAVSQGSAPLTAYYRLDSLSYAGENAKGGEVTNRDGLVKVNGLDPSAPEQPDSANNHSPLSTDETAPNPDTWQSQASGPQSAAWTFSAWNSWAELKSGYASSYARLIQQLAQRAAPAWTALQSAEQYGERLSKGDVRDLAALCDAPTVQTSGSGVTDVSASLESRPGLKPLFHIVVNKDQFGVEEPLDVSLTCTGIGAVIYHYFITPPAYRIMLPLITRPASGAASGSTASAAQVNGWGPWATYWVMNGPVEAPVFNQINANTSYNSSTCHSGCGATAWAMLFGWADYQARAANWWNYWKPRSGIFRLHGLPAPTQDDIAPIFSPDPYIDYITWEIRTYIHTSCWGSSGATTPWDMGQAYRYLALRTGARLETHFNILGASDDGLRTYAVNSIRNRMTPVVIGTGYFAHYPLAMGYMERSNTWRDIFGGWHTDYDHYFYVDQGWGGGGNTWVPADTWFSGEIYP